MMSSIVFIVVLFVLPSISLGQDTSIVLSRADTLISNGTLTNDTSTYLYHKILFGAVFGTPGILNFVAGYSWDNVGIRISGGGMFLLFGSGGLRGIQGNFSWVLFREENTLSEISLLGLTSSGISGTFYGVGASWSINIGGFFFEIGYPYRLDKNNLQFDLRPLLQIGYVH